MNSELLLFFFNNKYLTVTLCIPLLFLYLCNCFIENKHHQKEAIKKSNIKTNLMSYYFVAIILFILLLVINIPILKYVINIINFSYLIYILIFAPLFNKKLTYNFIESNKVISSFLLMELLYVTSKLKISNFESISNHTLFQISIIMILFITIFLALYILFINIKFIFYHLSLNYIKKKKDKFNKKIEMLDKKYNVENINNKINLKLTKFQIFIESTKQIILYTFFIIIIRSMLFAISYLTSTFTSCFSEVKKTDIYIISKITIVTTIFALYCIIQISNNFDTKIVSSYEFISSTIIIPLLLEKLLKNSNS